jgi:hypothetical protein
VAREERRKEESDHDEGPEGPSQEVRLLLFILGWLWLLVRLLHGSGIISLRVNEEGN